MENAAADDGALFEATVFLHHFIDLPDPRQAGKVTYPLDEVLLLSLLAVLAGAEAFVDIARFGCMKRDLLRRFRPFRTARPRTITSAISSPRSTWSGSSVAASRGSPR